MKGLVIMVAKEKHHLDNLYWNFSTNCNHLSADIGYNTINFLWNWYLTNNISHIIQLRNSHLIYVHPLFTTIFMLHFFYGRFDISLCLYRLFAKIHLSSLFDEKTYIIKKSFLPNGLASWLPWWRFSKPAAFCRPPPTACKKKNICKIIRRKH